MAASAIPLPGTTSQNPTGAALPYGGAPSTGSLNPFIPAFGTNANVRSASTAATSAGAGNSGTTMYNTSATQIPSLNVASSSDIDFGNLIGSLTGTYGEGLGDTLANFLNSGAGYNPVVAQALIAQMQPQIEQGQQNTLEEFAAGGDRFSSSAALGLSNYNAQTTSNENATLANLYQDSVQNYLSTLMGTSSTVAGNQSSIWDTLSSILGIGSEATSLESELGPLLSGLFSGGAGASAAATSLASEIPALATTIGL